MTKQEMIEAIYEKIADKSLTKGCKLYFDAYDGDIKYTGILIFIGFKRIIKWNY